MIVGTGIDFVDISRIAHWLDDEKLCARYFQQEEMNDILSRGSGAARSLAARFAAKEAFIKALGAGFADLSLKEVRVKSEPSGRPQLIVEGNSLAALNAMGARRIHLSLTHEEHLAAAQVILED